MEGDGPDELLAAVETAAEGLQEGITLLHSALERLDWIREQRIAGATYSESAYHATLSRLLETYTTSQHLLELHGHRLRTAAARTLRAEGFTISRIAKLFGVSRASGSLFSSGHIPAARLPHDSCDPDGASMCRRTTMKSACASSPSLTSG